MFMCVQSALPLSPSRGVFSQYELGGLGWGAGHHQWPPHAPVVERWAGWAARAVWWEGVGQRSHHGQSAGTVVWVQRRAERRPVWSRNQLNTRGRLRNQEEGSLVQMQIYTHSRCIMPIWELFFHFQLSWEDFFPQPSLTPCSSKTELEPGCVEPPPGLRFGVQREQYLLTAFLWTSLIKKGRKKVGTELWAWDRADMVRGHWWQWGEGDAFKFELPRISLGSL